MYTSFNILKRIGPTCDQKQVPTIKTRKNISTKHVYTNIYLMFMGQMTAANR